ncbi:MAG TPA: hypothetical protein VKA49_04795, partial [Flavitalea sp.]|nr:hypothetical protein [Flavitalea sp.]
NYLFTGGDISSHTLRTLSFYRTGNYIAGNNAWSGSYEYQDDSTQIMLVPADAGLNSMTYGIEQFSPDQIQFSSPEVEVNPDNPNATDYEKFVASEALSWLHSRNVDVSNFRTIQIQFAYSLKERDSTY